MTASSNIPEKSQSSKIPKITSVGVLSRPKTYSGSGTDPKYRTNSRSEIVLGARASSKILRANISCSTIQVLLRLMMPSFT
ncbi:hypothetical protein RclHR1_05460009 [Rhizophagus clarus]|nr:hypothetical protein RclHR1_05460009 [Rhizophagus clarus]